MSGDVVLDSVILIDHFNGVEEATAYLAQVGEAAAITAITRAEVLTGFDTADVPLALALLSRFRLIAIDGPVADLAAALRREHRWKLPDALQAAAARQHGLRLATRNTKDFPPAKHAFVVVPYTLRAK
ncbi:MAG: PIN domain-containing protein [Sandaracinaceae bacterium]|nr:PIN domain-containing protein [Sandaracinaceae bacterium]MBK7773632.1 PIN domain-containing protein [Sandaracinaceae bacterium]